MSTKRFTNEPQTHMCNEFWEFINRENVCVLVFNNCGVAFNYKGKNIWNEMGIPVFTYIVDHPRNFDDIFLKPMCDVYVFALDQNHVDFIETYYPKVNGVFFSPNGGSETGIKKNYKERNIDVLYMGNCQKKLEGFPEIPLFNDGGINFYNETLSLLIQLPMMSTESVIINYLQKEFPDLNNDTAWSVISLSAPYIEASVRRYFKLQGMHALDHAGVQVDVYGDYWEDDEPYSENIKIHPRIDINDLMKVISNAKISLCYIPWFKKGCSEKNFDSMLNGALCVSDKSQYLDKHYYDGFNIVYFDLNNPEQMAMDIKWLLEHPDEAEKIAQRGYDTAKIYDTWYDRSDYVLQKMVDVIIMNH